MGMLEEALAPNSDELMRVAADAMPIGLVMFGPDKRLILANATFLAMYALPEEQWRRGVTLEALLERRFTATGFCPEEVRQKIADVLAMIDRQEPNDRVDILPDQRRIRIKHQPLPNGGWVGTHEDVTEWMALQDQLSFLASHDPLTELLNRRAFDAALQMQFDALHDAPDAVFALHLIDLDKFKPVNDTYGHQVGDQVLVEQADRLRSVTDESCLAARIGGDEFAVLQNGVAQTGTQAAYSLSDEISATLEQPIVVDGAWLEVSATVGTTLCDRSTETPDAAIREADGALYRKKARGR